MCGRFIMTVDFAMLKAVFRLRAGYFDIKHRYNIAPGQDIPVVIPGPGGRDIRPMRWGLIPHWAGDEKIGRKLINARAETVGEKPSFKSSLRRRRCLVPASGFYEWQKTKNGKKKHLITLPDQEIMFMAGLYDIFCDDEGNFAPAFVIITTDANSQMMDIHNRMPVIVKRDLIKNWLTSGYNDYNKDKITVPYEGTLLIKEAV